MCYLKAQAKVLGTSCLFLFLILEFLIFTWSLVLPYLIFPPAFSPRSWFSLTGPCFPFGQQALLQSRLQPGHKGGEAEGSHSGLELCMDHTKIVIQVWLLAVTEESTSGEENQHLPWLPFLTPNPNYAKGCEGSISILCFLLQFLVESGDPTWETLRRQNLCFKATTPKEKRRWTRQRCHISRALTEEHRYSPVGEFHTPAPGQRGNPGKGHRATCGHLHFTLCPGCSILGLGT